MFTLFTQPFHLKGLYEIYEKSYGLHVASALSNTGKYGTPPRAKYEARYNYKYIIYRLFDILIISIIFSNIKDNKWRYVYPDALDELLTFDQRRE